MATARGVHMNDALVTFYIEYVNYLLIKAYIEKLVNFLPVLAMDQV